MLRATTRAGHRLVVVCPSNHRQVDEMQASRGLCGPTGELPMITRDDDDQLRALYQACAVS
jgi:hypothetical protein